MIRNDRDRYGAVAQIFHWAIAAMILVMFGLGWYMEDLPLSERKFALYQLHKSLGLTIFALALLRLGWRLIDPPPPLPSHLAAWERTAARASHSLLYVLIFVQPVIGFLQSNAAQFPVVVWDLVPLPAVIAPDEALSEILVDLHEVVAIMLALIVAIHAGAALRHHFWLKDGVLRRMLPGAQPQPRSAGTRTTL